MVFINIDDMTNDWVDMDIELEELELYPWVILNLDEIGCHVAYKFFDSELDVLQEYLDEEINDYLSNIHERILDKCIQVLKSNNVEVYENRGSESL